MRCFFICLLAVVSLAMMAQTPVSFKSAQTDTFYGKIVHDPYRMLEDTSNAAVKDWMRKEAAQAEAFFESMPGYKKLEKMYDSLLKNMKVDWIQSLTYRNGTYFVTKVMPGDDVPALYQVDKTGKMKKLVDPQKDFEHWGSKNVSIGEVQKSPHGDMLVYNVVVGGYEWDGRLVMHDLKTGHKVYDTLYLRMGNIMAEFDPETPNAFYYMRFPRFNNKAIDPTRWFDSVTVRYHVVGTDPATDLEIIGTDTTIIKRRMDEWAMIVVGPGLSYALCIVRNQVAPEHRIYVAPVSSLKSGNIPWKQLTEYSDAIAEYVVKDHWLYLRENKGTGRVLRLDLRNPSLASAVEIVPRGRQIIDAIAVTKNELLVATIDEGVGKLLQIPHGSNTAQALSLPVPGKVQIMAAHRDEAQFTIGLNSWVRPFTMYDYNVAAKRFVFSPAQTFRDTKQAPLELKTVKVKSHDGVMVPMTIIHKKGLKLDGTHPVSLRAYGSYGMQDEPGYWPEDMDWFNRGGIRTIAHVRGGGVYGEEWHRAGQKANKPNTWKDVIACAEWLIENKYATPRNLVTNGGSAGGITMGRTLTERPNLFGGMLIDVGALDMVRFETAPNGEGNVPEFGSVKTEEGFKALFAMSSYHHVKDGVDYPPVLLSHGINDNRVPVWTSLKMAARLREAGARNVLLRLQFDSGHGAQETISGLVKRAAQNRSFYYWRAGFPEFQPKVGF